MFARRKLCLFAERASGARYPKILNPTPYPRAQVQVVYTSSNGYADSWGKLYPFYVNKLCQLQDKVEQKLGALHG